MIRITKRVFADLAIYMIGFGVIIGIFFPIFLTLLGVPPSMAFAPWFFSICITAGIIVGVVNIILARNVVGTRLSLLAQKMVYISDRLLNDKHEEILKNCGTKECLIEVDSTDVLGKSTKSYNALVNAIFSSIKTEQTVRDFSAMLALRLELDDLAQTALPVLLKYTSTQAGAIIMERDGKLIVVASYRILESEKIIKSETINQALKLGKQKILDIPTDLVIEGALVDFTPRSVWIEPLLYHEIALGVIVLASTQPIKEEAQHFFNLVNASLSVAFRNALTHDQLQRLAANDPLTGMFNRRFGMARLQEEYGRAIRSGSPIGVCIFDLDHFKNVNDTHGHQMGDKVLVHVSNILRGALREGDVALRYGGEEFMAVLPGASITDAFQIADRVRRLVEETVFQHGSTFVSLTISGGISSWPDSDAASADALVRKADEALYRSKDTGRNKIIAL